MRSSLLGVCRLPSLTECVLHVAGFCCRLQEARGVEAERHNLYLPDLPRVTFYIPCHTVHVLVLFIVICISLGDLYPRTHHVTPLFAVREGLSRMGNQVIVGENDVPCLERRLCVEVCRV